VRATKETIITAEREENICSTGRQNESMVKACTRYEGSAFISADCQNNKAETGPV